MDGTPLPEADEEGGATCPQCGRTWYRNSAPTAGCVIVDGDRALVTVRARAPEAGRIDVPGGFLAPGEDVLEGLAREIREELSVEIEASIDDLIQIEPHLYGEHDDWVLAIGFKARLKSGEPQPADDVAEIRWVTIGDLDGLDFAWDHDRELVRRALSDGRP